MRAVVVREFGGPEVMRIEEVAAPAPGVGQAVVRVRAAGVNPVETYLRSGKHTRLPALPWTPGTDAAGVVEAVGAGVARFRVGDRVYVGGSLTGTYAELCLCRETQVHPLPARLSFAQGAAVHVPYVTAYVALFEKARLRLGEWVFVHGATGGVGLAAVQLARAAGARVVGSGGTDAGRALVLAQGAHHAVDHEDLGHEDEVVARTGGGPDVVVEMLADRNLEGDLTIAAPFGRIVVVGSRGSATVEPRKAMMRDLSVLGMSVYNVTERELSAVHGRLAAPLADGTLVPVVRESMPLADASRAHALVTSPGAGGKIVLVP